MHGIVGRLDASILVAATAITLTACSGSAGVGPKVFDTRAVEQQVSDQLFQQVHQRPKAISCPPNMEAKVGNTYRCTLTADDGTVLGLTVAVDSISDAGTGHFKVEVDNTPMSTPTPSSSPGAATPTP